MKINTFNTFLGVILLGLGLASADLASAASEASESEQAGAVAAASSAGSSDTSAADSQTAENQATDDDNEPRRERSNSLDDVIVVTATKREQTLQDVPFSINAQSQADIERTGADSIEELSRNVAGLTIQNLGPGQSQVAIRGVSAGQIVRDQPGVKEQVGVYLDESVISLSLFTPDLDLFDLNRVETLRGPQGTLFGSGSIGGTIRYITNQPNPDQHEGAFEAELNSIDDGGQGGHLKGMVNVPFGNGNGAFRLVGYHTEYGGYIDALREGGSVDNDVNSGSRSGIRAALTYEPTSNISLTPRLIYQEIGTDGFNRQEVFNLYANPYTTERPAVTFDEREQFLLLDEEFEDEFMLADLTATVGFDGFDLTSVTSITERDILVSRDASALSGSVSVDLGFPDEAVMLPSNLRDATDVEQLTQEVRLSSNTQGAFDWLVGAFYSDTERVYVQRLPTPGYDAYTDAVLGEGTAAAVANGYGADSPYNSDLPYDIEQLAVFGEANWYVTDRLTLTAGGRYYDFEEVRSFTNGGLFAPGVSVVDETSSDGFTPRVIADYKFNDFMSVNAQVAQGFRLGGVNDPLNRTLCTPEDLEIFGDFQDYDDETLWNYELGFKAQTRNVTFNAAVFHADINDLQVTLDAGSCSSRISFNVPSAHSTGFETELNWEPIDRLFLSFAGSVVEAEFDSTVFDADGNVLGGVQDGNRLPSVPEEQASLSGSYTFPVGWAGPAAEGFVTAAWQYIGSRYTQPGDQVPGAGEFAHGLPFAGMTGNEVTVLDLELPAYDVAYLSGGIDFGDYVVTLFVDNVFDENALLSFDRERGGRARLGFRTNQPRTYGINFRARF